MSCWLLALLTIFTAIIECAARNTYVVNSSKDIECTAGNTVAASNWTSLDAAVRGTTRGCIDLSGAQTILLQSLLNIRAEQEIKLFSTSGRVVLDAGHRHCAESLWSLSPPLKSGIAWDAVQMGGEECTFKHQGFKVHFFIQGSLFLEDLALQGGWSKHWHGGSLRFDHNSSVVARRVEFRNNAAISNGGVMTVDGLKLVFATFEDCIFSHNIAQTGGVLDVQRTAGIIVIVFERCSFSNNNAGGRWSDGQGGAIHIRGNEASFALASITFYECLFINNEADVQSTRDFHFLNFNEDGMHSPSVAIYGTQWQAMRTKAVMPVSGSSCSDTNDVSQGCTSCLESQTCDMYNLPAGANAYSCLPCDHCSVGTFRHNVTSECTVCPGGHFQPSTSESWSCLPCPAGKYEADDGTVASNHDACETCPAGNSSVGGSRCCEGSGFSANERYDDGCRLCPAGKFSQSSECHVCPAGKYTSIEGHSDCISCPRGTYLEDDGVNQYAHGSDMLCRPCPVGKASAAPGSASCETCAAGRFSGGMGNSQCQECTAGLVSDGLHDGKAIGDFQCTPCSAGTFAKSTTTCEPCATGNFFAKRGSFECKMCPTGKVPHDDKSDCRFCSSDQIAEEGECRSCPILLGPNEGQSACTFNLRSFVMITYMVLLSMLMWLLFTIFFSRHAVVDVSLKQGKAILTTLTNHHLSCPPCRPNFPIKLHSTCHPKLDANNRSKLNVAKARVSSSNTLELLDAQGNSINERLDTSRGTLSLTYADLCMHVSLKSIPAVLIASVNFLAVLLLAIHNLTAFEIFILTPATVVASAITLSFMKVRQSYIKSPLEKRLDEFRSSWLCTVNPNPTSCPKGPGRAIMLDKILETLSFFRIFIQDRTAYYLDANILKPLTAKHRLSYAELVGPEQVDFFVSHFWGTEFTHFCETLQMHAETVTRSGTVTQREMPLSTTQLELGEPFKQRQHVAYWICFCSNNQYDIHNELGGDAGWQESSFYLALQSPSCQCTCMVLDVNALPLTRSWCIFETLQSLKLAQTRPGFDLLMCTASGVLNFGNSSIEAAMGIVKRVACMDLHDAQSSNEADKEMIDSLVLEEMGSFDLLNDFIRQEIHVILEKAQKTCTYEFENLFNILEAHSKMRTTAKASFQDDCMFVDSGTSVKEYSI